MSFTSNSDLYVAIHDGGINRIVKHVMRQRPSLFNYGTEFVAQNPRLACSQIDASPDVIKAGDPLFTIMGPLPVFSTDPLLQLNFSAQLTKGLIDFHPSNVFSLPPELGASLANQNFGIFFSVCAGIGCIKEIVRDMPIPILGPNSKPNREPIKLPPMPTPKLECFCLDLFATGSCRIFGTVPYQTIVPKVEGIEIVDLKPEGIENSIECYAFLVLNQGILPQIGKTISEMAFGIIKIPDSLGTIQIAAATAVPNNPAIEEDQLKSFINIHDIVLDITTSGPSGGGGGGGSGGTITRTIRPRTRPITDTFDLTAAVSDDALGKFFNAVMKGFKFKKTNIGTPGTWGPFSATYNVEAHLENGSIELRNDGTIHISELDVVWDVLHLDLGFDLPKICIPPFAFCAVPPGFPKKWCAVWVEPYCIFGDNPDFTVHIDLSHIFTSEISFTAGMRVYYGIESGAPINQNRWQIVMVPTLPFDLDIIDFEETIGDLVDKLVDTILDGILGGIPDEIKGAMRAAVTEALRPLLDIFDDAGEWVLDALTELGIFDLLLGALDDHLSNIVPPIEIKDPFEVLPDPHIKDPAKISLLPVKLPIEFIGIKINSSEILIQGDVGN